jgi:hypothetical protein
LYTNSPAGRNLITVSQPIVTAAATLLPGNIFTTAEKNVGLSEYIDSWAI